MALPLKVSPREGFIHHDDVTAAIVVLLGNRPAALDCRPYGLEIVRTDGQVGRLVPAVARRRIGLSGNEDTAIPIVKSHGSIQRIADRLDPGNPAQPLKQEPRVKRVEGRAVGPARDQDNNAALR